MIILDEHFPDSQRQLLQGWRIRFRQIGYETGRSGMKDYEIIPFLHQLHRPTFFTLDFWFNKRELCHARYCLVYLDVDQYEAAKFVRRFLRQNEFSKEVNRLGKVFHVSPVGIAVWRLHASLQERIGWSD